MDLSRVYTKTSKGILEGNAKSRGLTREHGRVLALIDGKSTVSDLLEKNSRISENRLAAILDELTDFGMIRQLSGALAVDDLGFSSTIIVAEANTQAFFEAQAHLDRELRRTEDKAALLKQQEREALLDEVKADIQAEADSIKREIDDSNAKEAQAASLRDAASKRSKREAEAKIQAEVQAKASEERARKQLAAEARAREEAEARAKALEAEVFARAEVARKAKQEAAERAQAEADAKARMAAEKKAREQAEKQALAAEKAREAAERHARKEIEDAARLARVAEDKANARRALEAKIQAEEEAQRRADMEARMRQMEQEKQRAQEEAQALAKALDEARVASELESRVKRRIEARAREEEEARLRVEAEARAKLEEAARLQQEAEARAREEAEARRLAEEAQRKAEQDAQAQLEAERLARKEAEARAIAEAEAQRQAEAARLEAEQRAEEARKAREAAESEARAIAEAQARAEAEAAARQREEAAAQAAEQARQEAARRAEEEQKAREEAARLAQIEAERLAAEAEARAVEEAEAAVRREAEDVKRKLEEAQRAEEARLAREESERQQAEARAAAEAAEEKSRAEAAARERAEADARERQEARLQARERAEAAARAEAEEAMRRQADAAQREEAEEDRMRAEAQARAMAASKGEALFPFFAQPKRPRWRLRLDKKLIKPALYALTGLLLVTLVVVHLVSFNFYLPKLEQQLSAALGQRVAVKEIRFSAYPAPHLKLEGVAIGDLAEVRISSARLFPLFSSWFSAEKTLHRVELDAVSLSESSAGAFAGWSRQQAGRVPMHFETVRVKDAKLAHRLFDLPAFNADVKMDRGRLTQAKIESTDQRITIDITPQAEGVAINVAGARAVLPLEPRLQFDDLKISAIARPDGMALSQIEGQLYGGSVSGSAQVSWRDGWAFSSDLGVRQVAVEPSLPLFTRNIKGSGTLEAKIRLSAKAATLENLFNTPQVQATFRLRDGEVAGVDLVRAIQSARSSGNSGGKTHFNELSGYLQLGNGRYQYRQLKLSTGVLNATGNVDVSAERTLSGNLLGELRTRATSLRTGFALGGTLETPTLKLSAPAQRPAPVKDNPVKADQEAQ